MFASASVVKIRGVGDVCLGKYVIVSGFHVNSGSSSRGWNSPGWSCFPSLTSPGPSIQGAFAYP